MAADGYALEVSGTDSGGLVVAILAGPDACQECLIPKEVFAGMLSSRLNSEGMEFSGLTLVYPSDRLIDGRTVFGYGTARSPPL